MMYAAGWHEDTMKDGECFVWAPLRQITNSPPSRTDIATTAGMRKEDQRKDEGENKTL
jgi:hypothetical protein